MLIPILYLKGVPTGAISASSKSLLGKDAPGLSASQSGTPPPHGALKGMSVQQDRARHDLQARRSRREKLASPR